MKIDEDGVCYEVDESDVVDGTLVIPEGVKKIDWGPIEYYSKYYQEYNEQIEFIRDRKRRDVGAITSVVVLPQSLIEIGDESFSDFIYIEEFVIPNSVTKIGEYTFCNCHNLKHISLSRSLKDIPFHCFSSCEKLEALIIPDSVTSVASDSFSRLQKYELFIFWKKC